jgi:hypothetical protein
MMSMMYEMDIDESSDGARFLLDGWAASLLIVEECQDERSGDTENPSEDGISCEDPVEVLVIF